jgi:RNA polymerase sigma-70 factor (ECF subfamily)
MTCGQPAASPDAEDRLLVARFNRGDHAAFDRLVARHQDRIAALACRLLGWQQDIDDVVQDVFLTMLQNLPGFRGESRLSTWLFRITVNQCRRPHHRRAPRLQPWPEDALPHATHTPLDRESSNQVRGAVAALPNKYREVVVLRYLEELPILDIAVILGLSRNAVEVRLNRARRQLKRSLGNLLEK